MPELGSLGSVRGTLSNGRPYRSHKLKQNDLRKTRCSSHGGNTINGTYVSDKSQ